MSGCRTRVSFRTAMVPALLTQSVTAYRGIGSVAASGVTALKVTVLSEPPPSTPWFLYSRWPSYGVAQTKTGAPRCGVSVPFFRGV